MANEGTAHDSVKDGVRQIEADLNSLHQDVKSFEERLRALEEKAVEAGLPHVEYALRDAYARASKAGGKLVEAHLALRSYQPQSESEQEQVTQE